MKANGKYRGLFITDLDGTLLSDERCLAAKELESLHRLRQHDIAVAIATGRSRYSIEKLLALHGYLGTGSSLCIDYIIFSTGAGVMDFPGGKMLKKSLLLPEDVASIITRLEPFGVDYMVHEPIPGTRYFHYHAAGGGNPDFSARIGLYKQYASPYGEQTMSRIESVGGATEVLCIAAADHGHELAAQLTLALPEYSVIKATSPLDHRSVWIEIFARGVSKSTAAGWLAASLSLGVKQVCAVGNDYNDEDLLGWAGKGYLTANGPEVMKTHYETVPSNNEGGVSAAAARWLTDYMK